MGPLSIRLKRIDGIATVKFNGEIFSGTKIIIKGDGIFIENSAPSEKLANPTNPPGQAAGAPSMAGLFSGKQKKLDGKEPNVPLRFTTV